jgi:hypothetical protein
MLCAAAQASRRKEPFVLSFGSRTCQHKVPAYTPCAAAKCSNRLDLYRPCLTGKGTGLPQRPSSTFMRLDGKEKVYGSIP